MLNQAKRFVRQCTERSPFVPAITVLERLQRRPTHRFAVLMYHRVADPRDDEAADPSLISATPESFAEQVDFFRRHGHLLSLTELLQAIERRQKLPARSVLITFDDADRDFAAHAWPILRERGAPVTVFVPTDYPDRPEMVFWWDQLHVVLRHKPSPALAALDGRPLPGDLRKIKDYVKSLPHDEAMRWVGRTCREHGIPEVSNRVLSWSELRRLKAEGVTLAPHSKTHPLMTRVDLSRAREEAAGSLDALQREVGEVPRVFAYPSGDWSPAVAELLEELGFRAAFTTARRANDLRRLHPMAIARINVGRATGLGLLRAQVALWPSPGAVRATTSRIRPSLNLQEMR